MVTDSAGQDPQQLEDAGPETEEVSKSGGDKKMAQIIKYF
jgi:hypothetical protein